VAVRKHTVLLDVLVVTGDRFPILGQPLLLARRGQLRFQRVSGAQITRGSGKAKPAVLVSGPLMAWDLESSADGIVFVTGRAKNEGTLPKADRVRLEEHVAECPYCEEYIAQMRQTIGALGGLPAEPLDPGREAELLEAFLGWRRT
jgi:hypothetical protein